MEIEQKIVIAGPCAVESRQQITDTARSLKERDIEIMRTSLWKPRTRSGFDGIGLEGAPWLAEVTNLGVTVGTEVLLPDHVTGFMSVIQKSGNPEKLFFWLGSRNQNHIIQKAIAQRVRDEAPDKVKLLIKNQPWGDEGHWLGIVDHVTQSGLPPERIILCHRGFSPYGQNNPDNFRNLPDFEMAMRVRQKTGLPMLIDPSHIGGSVENVFKVIELVVPFNFDGLMIEVHPSPQEALTDKNQQLSFEQLDQLLKIFNQ
jgi:chorismate mutase